MSPVVFLLLSVIALSDMNFLGNLLAESDALEAPSRAYEWGRFLDNFSSTRREGKVHVS